MKWVAHGGTGVEKVAFHGLQIQLMKLMICSQDDVELVHRLKLHYCHVNTFIHIWTFKESTPVEQTAQNFPRKTNFKNIFPTELH